MINHGDWLGLCRACLLVNHYFEIYSCNHRLAEKRDFGVARVNVHMQMFPQTALIHVIVNSSLQVPLDEYPNHSVTNTKFNISNSHHKFNFQ